MFGSGKPHRNGYYAEHDHLAVTDGAIQRKTEHWTAYRKSDACFLTYVILVCATLFAGGVAIAAVLIRDHMAPVDNATQAAVANIVPRFPAMQFTTGSFNGTQYSANHTQNAVSTGISTGIHISTADPAHCTDETETQTSTHITSETSMEQITTIKKTLTQTRTLQESVKGTTVSSALAVTGTQSGTTVASQSVDTITEFITSYVTETAIETASVTPTESSGESTSQVQTPSMETTSVFLTKTRTAVKKVTSTVREVVVITTYTPTSIVLSTVTVTPSEFVSTQTHEAQCSPDDHTVYVTVTKAAELGSSSLESSTVMAKTKIVSPSSPPSSSPFSSSPAPSHSTETVLATYTVTVDSLKPISKAPVHSSPSGVSSLITTVISGVEKTLAVTEMATQTVFETVIDGTTVLVSTAVSSVLGTPGTPVWISPSPSTLHGTATVTKTVTDMVTESLSASAADVLEASSTTVIASSSSALESTQSVFTTVYLANYETRTLTVDGIATITLYIDEPTSSALNSTNMPTKTDVDVITEVDINTITVTVDGEVETSVASVPKSTNATLTQMRVVTETGTSTITNTTRIANNTIVQPSGVTVNTTIYITGTPMMHPTTAVQQPPYPTGNSTVLFSSTGTGHPVSTMPVVVSNAEKRAEPFGFSAVDRNSMTCQTCLVMFVLGLFVLF
ncbi:uncharacterized protein CTRU02_213619 [Colletotrichum truncatum]|uniref:Uncharacterized protein n=1 Tax=Colletotrichum truncatum TaxID=5467 RepID=A0ACC3YGB1_COLTU|nr:uncharacterized protein CTRU02_11807 [Colletotrichum truncatum]KAF6785507.1 hypothetical protein CTRU02_11807 [Colletotrichum truncatum]